MSKWRGYCHDCKVDVALAMSLGYRGDYHCTVCDGYDVQYDDESLAPEVDNLYGIDMLNLDKIIERTDEVLVADIKREEVLRILGQVVEASEAGKWSVEIPTTLNEEQCWYVVHHWLPRFSVRTDIPHFGSPRGTQRVLYISWLRIKAERS